MKLAPVALVLLFALAGCGGSTPPEGDGPTHPSAASSPTVSTPADAGGAACTRDDLEITYAATDNTAGQMHGVLSMLNDSPAACTLSGYPILFLGSGEVAEPIGQQAAFDDTATDEGFPLE